MADIFHGACAACHLPFMFGDLVVPVEEVRDARDTRVEVTEKGYIAHLKCPEVFEDEE